MARESALRAAAEAAGLDYVGVAEGQPSSRLLSQEPALPELPDGTITKLLTSRSGSNALRVFEISHVEPSAFEGSDVLSYIGALMTLEAPAATLVVRTIPRVPRSVRRVLPLVAFALGAGFGGRAPDRPPALGDKALDDRCRVQGDPAVISAVLSEPSVRLWLLGLSAGWMLVVRDRWLLVLRSGELSPKTLAQILDTAEAARRLARPA